MSEPETRKKESKAETDRARAEPAPSPEELAGLRQKAAERDEFYDRYMRAAADYQNLRKRMEKDVATRSEDLLLGLVQGLILVLDHLDLALRAASPGTKEGLQDGVQLIHKEIEALLAKHGVQPIQAHGKPFDPKFHEAVVQEVRAGAKAGEVLEELRKGYRWGERVVRPAQVKVAAAEEGKKTNADV